MIRPGLLLVLLASCAGKEPPVEVTPAAMTEHLRREQGGQLLYVRARALAGEGTAGLRIDEARVVGGRAPFLWPDPRLEGRLDLLDAGGKVLWSMQYQPAPAGAPLAFRLPVVDGAAAVRLSEPTRNASATAAITSAAAR
jgi:hypothetical protein